MISKSYNCPHNRSDSQQQVATKVTNKSHRAFEIFEILKNLLVRRPELNVRGTERHSVKNSIKK